MLSGITTLSEDLLQLLFEHVLDRSDPKAYHDQLTTLRLFFRSWNHLIERSPILWSIINIAIRLPLEAARLQLRRSGDSLPLHVDMTLPLSFLLPDPDFRCWTKGQRCWRKLYFPKQGGLAFGA